jgi:folate-binding protein YgfZ
MNILNRALIRVTGTDGLSLLHKLTTQDLLPLQGASAGSARYTLLLTPQGRYAFDFFVVVGDNDHLFIDIAAHQADDIIATLAKYRLRSDVDFARVQPATMVLALESPTVPTLLAYADPRNTRSDSHLGWRIWHSGGDDSVTDAPAWYMNELMAIGIVEPSLEMVAGQDLPLEFGLHKANAISFSKGCFLGQELTARSYNKQLIKHQIFVLQSAAVHPRGTPVCAPDGSVIGDVVRGDSALILVRIRVTYNPQDGVLIGGVPAILHFV